MPDLEALTAAEQQGYTYQRSDGTIEHAATQEEVFARCSKMAELAIEDPEQANALMELSAMSGEEIAAVAQEKPTETAPTKDVNAREEANQQKKIASDKVSKQLATIVTGKDLDEKASKPVEEAAQPIPSQIDRAGIVATSDKAPTVNEVSVEAIRADEARVVSPLLELPPEELATMAEVASPTVSQEQENEARAAREVALLADAADRADDNLAARWQRDQSEQTIVDEDSAANQSLDVVRSFDPVDAAVTTRTSVSVILAQEEFTPQGLTVIDGESSELGDTLREGNVDFGIEFGKSDLFMPVDAVVVDGSEDMVIVDTEDGLSELSGMEIGLTDEDLSLAASTIEDELVALAYAELFGVQEATLPDTDELHGDLIEDQVVGIRLDVSELVAVNPFEAFIVSQNAPEDVPDIETITAQANDQPLEETLMQLAFCLSEASEGLEEPSEESQSAQQLLKDVKDILHQLITVESNVEQAEQPRLTPDLTQKLLLLLGTIGYHDPQAALLEFVEQHNFEYLVQAIGYLGQLSKHYDRQEFLLSKLTASSSVAIADEPTTTRLGKIIFRLFRARTELPELAAA
jgi:hypothetical protein